MRLTRRYKFSASHRLHSPKLSDSENREIYGKCNNPYGHGHNYVLEVSVRGPVDDLSGRVVNRDALDRLVKDEILDQLDHANLNTQVPALAEMVPTTENLALDIRTRLNRRWCEIFPGPWPKLDGIRIQETGRNIFELISDQ